MSKRGKGRPVLAVIVAIVKGMPDKSFSGAMLADWALTEGFLSAEDRNKVRQLLSKHAAVKFPASGDGRVIYKSRLVATWSRDRWRTLIKD